MQIKWFARGGLLALIAGGLAVSVTAHDEDWRKLRDREDAYVGPIVTFNDLAQGGELDEEFDAENVIMQAWIPLSEFPGTHNSGNDCWGYTSATGREYAIMCLQRGYGFVEITDPVNPVIIDVVSGPSSTWHDLKVIGDYGYGVSEAGSGIQVIDLSRIDEGIVRHVQDKTQLGHSSTHNIAANPDSGFLYLCGANIAGGGLVAVDTVDPENPTIRGQWTGHYVHDAQIVTYTDGPYAGRELAYCFNESRIDVLDVTDKGNMHVIGTTTYAGASYTHQGWLTPDRQFLYCDDELDEQGGVVSTTTTRIFDVSDPANPTFVGSFSSGASSIDHNLYTKGDFLYEANYRSGLRVFDISDPTNPEQVGFFDTYPGSDSANFNGAWSCYPYFASGTILISDIERGLFIVRYHDSGAELQIVGGPAATLAPSGEAVQVDVIETTGAVVPSTVTLHVRDSTGERSVPMTGIGSDRYEGAFGALPCFESIDYWITAETVAGDIIAEPSGAPTVTHQATVQTGSAVSFEDDFSTHKGWTVGAPGDTAFTGIWERAVPQATAAQPGSSPTGGPVYVTDARAGFGVGDWDVDGGKTTLLSPLFDLSAGGNPSVSYDRWYNNSAGATPFTDVFTVDVSDDGGLSWTNIETVGPSGAEVSGGWYHVSHPLGGLIALTDEVRFRFIADDAGDGSIVEAAIDDFRIEEIQCDSVCYADCDGSGDLDFFDFLCFQDFFSAGEPLADCDGSGGLDFFDFLCFQNEFSAGCP
jgi:choice-of-anchor B domain-containing protein